MFILPSKTTLKTMISHLNIGAGINSQIFELIKEQVTIYIIIIYVIINVCYIFLFT